MEQRALKYTLPEAQNRPESGVAYRVHIQGPDGALCGFRGHSEAWWELVVDAEEMRSMVTSWNLRNFYWDGAQNL